jgi:glycosyltransferase involved in cell wall biosynthesis
MPPLLSIAIPTYQRKHWLQRNLSGLLQQLETLPVGLVEIVISENSGSDGTWEYLENVARANPHIVLNRNKENIGAEGNCYLLPKLASGKYLWILGDDDFLIPGALSSILEELRKEPDYVAVNFAPSDETLTRKGAPYWAIENNVEVFGLNQCCTVVPHFAMGFISAWIARRDFYNRISAETYIQFAKWGLSVMLDRYVGLAEAEKVVVIAQVMLTTRKPAISEYPAAFDYFTWFFEGSTAVFSYLQSSTKIGARVIQSRKAWLLRKIAIKRILYERGTGTIDVRKVNAILFCGYRDRWEYWLACIPALYFPGLGFAVAAVLRSKQRKQRVVA